MPPKKETPRQNTQDLGESLDEALSRLVWPLSMSVGDCLDRQQIQEGPADYGMYPSVDGPRLYKKAG